MSKLESVAICYKGGKASILEAGDYATVRKAATEYAQGIKEQGSEWVQVFGPCTWGDDGSMRVRDECFASIKAKQKAEAEKKAAGDRAKKVTELERQLAEAKGEKPAPPPATKKATKKAVKTA